MPAPETDTATNTELEAAAFRRLVQHLRERTDVQNIDLMNLAGFCRNCLSRWYREAAESKGRRADRSGGPGNRLRHAIQGMAGQIPEGGNAGAKGRTDEVAPRSLTRFQRPAIPARFPEQAGGWGGSETG